MDERYLGREARQECRFFHGGVAAADHHDFLAREKEAIAGRAGRDTVADQRMLVRQAEPARRCSAGDDQRAGLNDLFADSQLKRTLAQIGFDHVAYAIVGAEARGLLAHILNQFRALDAVGKTGKVFHRRCQR